MTKKDRILIYHQRIWGNLAQFKSKNPPNTVLRIIWDIGREIVNRISFKTFKYFCTNCLFNYFDPDGHSNKHIWLMFAWRRRANLLRASKNNN